MSNVVSDAEALADLWSELDTEELPPPDELPAYVTEVPRDVRREEYVVLTPEEGIKVRAPEEPKGRPFSETVVDFVAGTLDRMIGQPIGWLFQNWLVILGSAGLLIGFA